MSDKPADVICEGDVCRRATPEEAAAMAAAPSSDAASVPPVMGLLGSTLLGKDGQQVPLSSVTGPGKVLAIYFSAHWCPPCRGFTPKLAAIYSDFKKSHPRAADWEVVFVSSDRDEQAFDEYFAEMPWLALPFKERDAKAELSKLYKIRGIPTLVIVDGETGELITSNGRDVVGDDEKCENFPWRPKNFEQIMEGAKLVDPKGAELPSPALDLLRGKVTLLYFSASWCPPCRAFTPKLVKCMEALRAANRPVETLFVSGDRQAAAMKEYHSHMTWPALPYDDKKRNSELNMLFQVEGIPTLVVLDEHFKVITDEGTGAVQSDTEGAKFPWRPQALEQLTHLTASRINSRRLLVLLLDAATAPDDAVAEKIAQEVLGTTAAEAVAADPEWAFLWARSDDSLAVRILEFAGGAKAVDGRVAMIMDVANSQKTWDLGAAGVALDAAGLKAAVADFKAGKLGPGRKLGEEEDD